MRIASLAAAFVRRTPFTGAAKAALPRGRRIANRVRRRFVIAPFHRLYSYTADEGGTLADTRWLGVGAAKCPLDLWIYQEILYERRPDVIVECGTAAGGSALFLASMCDLLGHGRVVTIDVLEAERPSHSRITYLIGSSVDPPTVERVRALIAPGESVMVILDSGHTQEHVLRELEVYADVVTEGQYMIVEDTAISGHPTHPELPPGPTEALEAFLPRSPGLRVDRSREKLLLTMNPGGYLERVS